MLALSGETPGAAAAVKLDGKAIGALCHRRAAAARASPRCRRSATGHAAVPDFSLADNAVLSARGRKGLVRQRGDRRRQGARLCRGGDPGLRVKATGPGATARVALGRQPAEVHHGARGAAATGGAGRLAADLGRRRRRGGGDPPGAGRPRRARRPRSSSISQDLDELLALSDSLAVINEGRLSPKRAIADFSIDEIGLLMGGVHGEAEHGAHVPAAAAGVHHA